jgi:hypothetical protein
MYYDDGSMSSYTYNDDEGWSEFYSVDADGVWFSEYMGSDGYWSVNTYDPMNGVSVYQSGDTDGNFWMSIEEEDGTWTEEYFDADGNYESTTYFNDGSSEYNYESADGTEVYTTETDWEGNEPEKKLWKIPMDLHTNMKYGLMTTAENMKSNSTMMVDMKRTSPTQMEHLNAIGLMKMENKDPSSLTKMETLMKKPLNISNMKTASLSSPPKVTDPPRKPTSLNMDNPPSDMMPKETCSKRNTTTMMVLPQSEELIQMVGNLTRLPISGASPPSRDTTQRPARMNTHTKMTTATGSPNLGNMTKRLKHTP